MGSCPRFATFRPFDVGRLLDLNDPPAWLQELGGSGAKGGGVAIAIVKANPAVMSKWGAATEAGLHTIFFSLTTYSYAI